jgi:hypothetical protein
VSSRGQPAVGGSEVVGLRVMLTATYSKKSVGIVAIEQKVYLFYVEDVA